MNTNDILDAPDKLIKEKPEKWKFASISILMLSCFFFFSIRRSDSTQLIIENTGILIALYFFIKKTKNLNHGQFFLWCNFIVFGSFLIAHLLGYIFGIINYVSFSDFIFTSFKYLLKSILNGYVLGLGVYSAISLRTGAPIAFAILISGVFTIGIIHNL